MGKCVATFSIGGPTSCDKVTFLTREFSKHQCNSLAEYRKKLKQFVPISVEDTSIYYPHINQKSHILAHNLLFNMCFQKNKGHRNYCNCTLQIRSLSPWIWAIIFSGPLQLVTILINKWTVDMCIHVAKILTQVESSTMAPIRLSAAGEHEKSSRLRLNMRRNLRFEGRSTNLE